MDAALVGPFSKRATKRVIAQPLAGCSLTYVPLKFCLYRSSFWQLNVKLSGSSSTR